MKAFLRFLLGILLLPLCWALARTFVCLVLMPTSNSLGFTAQGVSFCGGIAAFIFVWLALPRPMRTYVLGHELTHALWGLLFGAVPSDIRVTPEGGSVKLTKTNVWITLAPYFFPFWSFVVILVALVTLAFVRPLPWLPLWFFMIGFTWAFHVFFTLDSLTLHQPDIREYGRFFSWVFIFIANFIIMLIWICLVTEVTFVETGSYLLGATVDAYLFIAGALLQGIKGIRGLFK